MHAIIDDLQDQQLYQYHNIEFVNVVNQRVTRMSNAFRNYISSAYPVLPRVTLSDLQRQKQRYIYVNDVMPNAEAEQQIQEIQTKIDNQDYCIEGTPEWTTREEFLAYRANFVWPDADELAIRAQEEQSLLTLLSQPR